MNPAEALAELGELERFLAALNAQQLYGEHICCAAQPETVNGSPEVLIDDGRAAGAEVTGRWAEQVVEAIGDHDTESSIRYAILAASERFDLQAFARAAEETILRGLMLGALDSVWERENDELVAPAKFSAPGDRRFVHAPFTSAVEQFQQRQVLPPAAYKALQEGARKQAFTVAGLAKQELLAATHAELARQLREGQAGELGRGANLRDFKRFAEERLESAGWTPSNPSHVETIFRTNGVSAYSSGRAAEMSQPKVLAALPYWQIQTVRDARQRETHGKAHGIVLPATHAFWLTAYPPFGFNCRCRVCARTKAWLERMSVSVGPPPQNLPDPGFESGLKTLIQVPAAALASPPAPARARPPVPQRVSPNQLPLPYARPAIKLPSPSASTAPPLLPPKQSTFTERGITTSTTEGYATMQASAQGLFGVPLEAPRAERLMGGNHIPGSRSLTVTGRDNQVKMSAVYKTLAGEETVVVRRFSRKNGVVEVEHSLFEIDKALQGRGIAKAVLRDQVQEYQRLGVKRITMTAAWTGRYAWARMGFEYTGTVRALAKARLEFGKWLRATIGESAAAKVSANIKTLRELAMSRVGEREVGKEFLSDVYDEDEMFPMKLELDPENPNFKTVAHYLGL